nr:MAG TPA: hypothetical protein [Caudoviricetes sp.]
MGWRKNGPQNRNLIRWPLVLSIPAGYSLKKEKVCRRKTILTLT